MKTLPDYITDLHCLKVDALKLAITECDSGELALGEEVVDACLLRFKTEFLGCHFQYSVTPINSDYSYTEAAALRWFADALEGVPEHPIEIVKALRTHGALVTVISL